MPNPISSLFSSRNRLLSLIAAVFLVISVVFIIYIILIPRLSCDGVPCLPTPTAIVSTITPIPGTPTVFVTPTQTITPTPIQTITPMPIPTPTSIARVERPKYDGICLTSNPYDSRVSVGAGFEVITTTDRYPGFPTFSSPSPWCGTDYFLTTNFPTATIKIDSLVRPDFTIRSLFLMATISGNSTDLRDIAKITYTYNDGKQSYVRITPGTNIANSDYHQSPLRVNQDKAYRIWSGLSADGHGAQVLVLVLDLQESDGTVSVNLDENPLSSIQIERLTSPFSLDLYGLVVSNLTTEQIQQEIQQGKNTALKPLCFGDSQPDATVQMRFGREWNYSDVVNTELDYYYVQYPEGCHPIYSVNNIPDKLLADSENPLIRIPFILGPKIYESRPKIRRGNYPSAPTMTITISNPQKLAWVYLALSGRNLCNPLMSDDARSQFPNLGSIQLYSEQDDVSESEQDNVSKPVLETLITMENIGQGRSGISGVTSCPVHDEHGQVEDGRTIPGNSSFPLASRKTVDTVYQQVALWVNVISIQIPPEAGVITKIVLVDKTKPDPTVPWSRGDVDFTDPYLVLYGVTIEPRPPPPPVEPER